MHILIVTDQHVDSLGGAQVSIRLQRKYLERAGHTVSIVAPRRLDSGAGRSRSASGTESSVGEAGDAAAPSRGIEIDLPAVPITAQRDYGATWPGRRAREVIRRALTAPGIPRVDVVHVQGDFWGALLGYRVARHLRAPVVHTQHNNLDVGTRAVTSLAAAVFAGLRIARFMVLGRVRGRLGLQPRPSSGAWRYLADLATEAAAVTAPSAHFARLLEREGVATNVAVIPTGVDDDKLDELLRREQSEHSAPTSDDTSMRALQFIWLGRMSPEKRPLELIEAFAISLKSSAGEAELVMIGAGLLLDDAKALARKLGIEHRVHFRGPVPYRDALVAIHHADALVQTSMGFETQGMTPYEATALGTPTVFTDPDIAREIMAETRVGRVTPGHSEPTWIVDGDSTNDLAESLAAAATDLKQDAKMRRVSGEISHRFRQSRRTAQMIEVYERVLQN